MHILKKVTSPNDITYKYQNCGLYACVVIKKSRSGNAKLKKKKTLKITTPFLF
jgi:hypothetical protein